MRSSYVRAGLWGLLLAGIWARPTAAGPQHWGFGFSYLAMLEEVDGVRRLVVYEPPLHAKECTWPARWVDRTTGFADVAAGGLAVGDYWPASFGREYLTTLQSAGGNLTVKVYEPPDVFQVGAWALKSTSATLSVSGTVLGATAGDLRRLGKDQFIVALQDGGNIRIAILTPPTGPTGTAWSKTETVLPALGGSWRGLACGDFWDEDVDYLAVATADAEGTHLSFYSYNTGGNSFALAATDGAADLPDLIVNGLTAGDYQKDGFDVLTLLTSAGGFELRSAPARTGMAYDPGPEYDGKSYSGQWLPGNGDTASQVTMSGEFGAGADGRLAAGAGRVFGYIETDLNSRLTISTVADAQIAFARRSPRKDERPPYGWPAFGETVTWNINLNNNGATAVPGNAVRLKVWVNTPNRAADTDPLTCDDPDYDLLIGESLPAYDSNSPTYIARDVTLTWPYSLVAAGAGATWQRLNVHDVGERWVVAVLEYAGDGNLRNNRYEWALHGLTFHPIFRTQASLADRQPTVQGDPPSKEYLSRKLADAVQSMWERSKTRTGEDVLQRLWFDSYEIGWPDDQPDPGAAWAVVQAKYEGWRELDGWWGVYQNWERFNWGDGGAELHETGHLFHPIGDLYQYTVSPTFTGAATMADGAPVQVATWMWPADSFGSGHTRITWPACEMMRRHLVGVRNNGIEQWWTLISDRTFVRVLDRLGNPVSGAQVTLWASGSDQPLGSGTTGADGRWETTSRWGSSVLDAFGRKHFNSAFSGTQIYTVRIGANYQDCAVLGTEEVAAHSQHTRMGHSFTDQASWTWDLSTNFASTAAVPDFEVTAAVQNRSLKLGVTGPTGAVYRLYRKWEPAYIRTLVGEYSAAGETLTVTADLGAADSYTSNRFRGTYGITRVIGAEESLPKVVQVTGLSGVRGVSTRGDGRLLVAANMGIANPFCQVFEGTTPYQELFYHYRFGHTAHRVVASQTTPGKYYATLVFADVTPEYRFDLVDPPTGTASGYDVRNDIPGGWIHDFGSSAPYWVQFNSTTEAQRFLPGDQLNGSTGSAQVTQVSGDTIYVDALVFSAGQLGYSGYRLAGKTGSTANLRELSSARGLATIVHNGSEYVVIADTGNRRVVVWDERTAYVTHWQSGDSAARPAAVAAHPVVPNSFFVIDRRASGASKLYRFTFDGSALAVDAGYPVNLAVGDATTVTELGLAAEIDPATTALALLITDARNNRVVELTPLGSGWQTAATYTQATGVYAGSVTLSRPGDVTYARVGHALQRYAVDSTNRLVLLSTAALSNPDCNGNGVFDTTDLAQGTSLDCNTNGVPDECDVAVGASLDVNSDGVPDECVRDCNSNSVDDVVDISAGTCEDCNTNGVPDECEVASGIVTMYWLLDTDPGWTTEGLWAWGQPTGQGGGGGGGGRPDPTSGHTGSNVYGYNLAGNYENSLPERHLTSGPLDCAALNNVTLSFWRYLGVEESDFDHACLRVSNNGTNWVTIWQNSGEVRDTAWVYQQYDISAVADGRSTVYLRWTMGPTDESLNFCGWNIDDIEVRGEAAPAADCNGNAVPDDCDIAAGTSLDCNANSVPDECETFSAGDADGDGTVSLADYALLPDCLSGPDQAPAPPVTGCGAACLTLFDFDADGDVDLPDFAAFQAVFATPR